jgi:hypothetical protein
MLFGAAGQSLSMVILAVCTSPAALKPEGGDPRNPGTRQGPAFAAAVFLFVVSFPLLTNNLGI